MKKTLVALAALAVVGAASAQSTVTLYGRLDASVGQNEVKHSGPTAALAALSADPGPNVNSSTLSGSRWGMRGTEDLGGGMNAVFTLEGGINLDKGTQAQGGRLFGRQAFVGLNGGWGAVTMGRQYTIMSGGVWALTGGYANYDAWYSATDNAGFGNAASISEDAVRKDNSILYVSPSFSGFSGQFMWAPGENGQTKAAGGKSSSNYTSLGLGYVNGPINIQFAYEWDKVLPTLAPSPVGQNQDHWGIAGAYNFGVVAIQAAWQQGSLDTGAGSSFKDEGYALGGNGNLGPVNIALEYAYEKTKFAGTKLSDADALNIRVTYPLSKRTDLYGFFTDGNAKTVVGDSQDLRKFQLGVRHSF